MTTAISLCLRVDVRAPGSADECESEKKDTGMCFSLLRRITSPLFAPAPLVLWDSEEKNGRGMRKVRYSRELKGRPAGWQVTSEMESRKFWERRESRETESRKLREQLPSCI